MPRGKKAPRQQCGNEDGGGLMIPAEVISLLFTTHYLNYNEMSRARGISRQVKNYVEHLMLSRIQSITAQVEVTKKEMAKCDATSRENKQLSGSKRKHSSPPIVPLHREVCELDEILTVFWLYKQRQTERRMGLYWGRFVDVCSECTNLIQSTLTTPDTPYRNVDRIKQQIGDLFGLLQRDTATIGNELRDEDQEGGEGNSRRSRPKRAKSNFVLNNLFMQLVNKHMSEGTLEEFRNGVSRDSYGKRCSYGSLVVSTFQSSSLSIVDMDGSITKKIGG